MKTIVLFIGIFLVTSNVQAQGAELEIVGQIQSSNAISVSSNQEVTFYIKNSGSQSSRAANGALILIQGKVSKGSEFIVLRKFQVPGMGSQQSKRFQQNFNLDNSVPSGDYKLVVVVDHKANKEEFENNNVAIKSIKINGGSSSGGSSSGGSSGSDLFEGAFSYNTQKNLAIGTPKSFALFDVIKQKSEYQKYNNLAIIKDKFDANGIALRNNNYGFYAGNIKTNTKDLYLIGQLIDREGQLLACVIVEKKNGKYLTGSNELKYGFLKRSGNYITLHYSKILGSGLSYVRFKK